MRGWKITLTISLGLTALTSLQLVIWGYGEEGIRVWVRSTARSSVVLFALAFTASSLRSLWRSDVSRWLLTNRRYLGVSYAVSHFLHAIALVALLAASSEFAESLEPITLVGGGLAYLFTAAMALTSSDAAVAALGRRSWRRLHLVGGWTIWIIFAQIYLPRAATDPWYLPVGLWVLAIPALRFAARTRRAPARTQPV